MEALDFLRLLLNKPIIPLGRKIVTKIKIAPRVKSQTSGNALVSIVLDPLTKIAPKTGPINVPLPPTATHTTASIELAGENSPGLIIPT